MIKEELSRIIDELVGLGEDKDEMDFWLSVYDDLPGEKQNEIAKNLTDELERLKKVLI